MSKKKLLLLTLVLTFVGLSLAVGSRVFSYYRGYHHFSQGEVADYLIERWKERLDLTDAQATQMKALIEDTRGQRESSRQYMRAKGKEMMDLFFQEGTTKEQLEVEMEDMHAEISKMMTTFAGLAIDIKDTLTPEQLEKMRTYYEEKSYCRYKY
jgi:Spy/CpxP family protein refolding chaperone